MNSKGFCSADLAAACQEAFFFLIQTVKEQGLLLKLVQNSPFPVDFCTETLYTDEPGVYKVLHFKLWTIGWSDHPNEMT